MVTDHVEVCASGQPVVAVQERPCAGGMMTFRRPEVIALDENPLTIQAEVDPILNPESAEARAESDFVERAAGTVQLQPYEDQPRFSVFAADAPQDGFIPGSGNLELAVLVRGDFEFSKIL